jgi:hypothetical protein
MNHITLIPPSSPLLPPSSPLPVLVAAAGERGGTPFLEFFAASIRKPHTRRAYSRAVSESLIWCERVRGAPMSSQRQTTAHPAEADVSQELDRVPSSQRSFATVDLPEGKVMAIGAVRMDLRHTHLDKMLDPE